MTFWILVVIQESNQAHSARGRSPSVITTLPPSVSSTHWPTAWDCTPNLFSTCTMGGFGFHLRAHCAEENTLMNLQAIRMDRGKEILPAAEKYRCLMKKNKADNHSTILWRPCRRNACFWFESSESIPTCLTIIKLFSGENLSGFCVEPEKRVISTQKELNVLESIYLSTEQLKQEKSLKKTNKNFNKSKTRKCKFGSGCGIWTKSQITK